MCEHKNYLLSTKWNIGIHQNFRETAELLKYKIGHRYSTNFKKSVEPTTERDENNIKWGEFLHALSGDLVHPFRKFFRKDIYQN